MPSGYTGKIAHIDLSAGKVEIETPAESFYRHYWGGQGLVGYYLLHEMPAGVDPLGPDNLLVFATGVMTGGPMGGFGRHSVGARSPLTGGFGESEAGGYWGAELKKAGLDALVIAGCAPRPVYVWVQDGEIEIRPADDLWGRTTAETLGQICSTHGDSLIRAAMIGPAGENLVRFACINHDLHYFAGRTGLGAVMGAKKLKAVAVRGHQAITPADPEVVRQVARWLSQTYPTNAGMSSLHINGTAGGVSGLNTLGALATRNFQEGFFEGAKAIAGETLTETMLAGRNSCYACPVRCKRVVTARPEHPFDPKYGGPEFETLAAFGSNCGVDDLAAVCKANALCSAYGLDSISTGVTISFAMECFENGLIPAGEAGGLELRFGSSAAMLGLIEQIAHREGLGDLLAEGTRRASEKIGGTSAEYAMHVMGQEIPLQEPRLAHHRGLGYVINETGADHLAGAPETFFEKEGPRLASYRALGSFQPSPLHGFDDEKLRLFVYSHIWYSFADCAVLCLFIQYSFEQVRQLAQAMTGWETSIWEMMKVGERAATMAQAFNVREGLDPRANKLPKRFYRALKNTPTTTEAIDPDRIEWARRRFLVMLGWDAETGAPTSGKLAELGLGWVEKQLACRPEIQRTG